MHVVPGRVDRPTVNFEGPPWLGLEQHLQTFLEWYEASRAQAYFDPLLRAGIAPFWFVTPYP